MVNDKLLCRLDGTCDTSNGLCIYSHRVMVQVHTTPFHEITGGNTIISMCSNGRHFWSFIGFYKVVIVQTSLSFCASYFSIIGT